MTEAERVIEPWGRVIYAGQDDLNPYRKWILFWGQQATRHLLDLPYEIHVSVCVNVSKGGPIKSNHNTHNSGGKRWFEHWYTLQSVAGGPRPCKWAKEMLWIFITCVKGYMWGYSKRRNRHIETLTKDYTNLLDCLFGPTSQKHDFVNNRSEREAMKCFNMYLTSISAINEVGVTLYLLCDLKNKHSPSLEK